MAKVFVVPKLIGSARRLLSDGRVVKGPYCIGFNPKKHVNCAAQALAAFFELSRPKYNYQNELEEKLGLPYGTVWDELVKTNDNCATNEERRQNLISFLRKYFPKQEVK